MRRCFMLAAALSITFARASMGADWHVAPGGAPQGDGSEARPWDLATALAQPAIVRISGIDDFWVVWLLGAYESSEATDFDPNTEEPRLGSFDDNEAYVYFEEIRDRAAFAGSADFPLTVDEARLQQRTVLHELGHVMGAPHNLTPLGGTMNPASKHSDWTDAQAVFTVAHWGIFQSKKMPDGVLLG